MPKVTCTALNIDEGPHLEIFRKAGFDVAFPPPGVNLFKAENLVSVLSDSDAVVAGSEPYTREVIEALPRLRVIARRGVGYDAIDLAAADDKSIVVTTTPGTLHHAVAEHTIALLMGVARGFPRVTNRSGPDVGCGSRTDASWGRLWDWWGWGKSARRSPRCAVGLGLNVVAYDPYPNRQFAQQWKIEFTGLDTLLGRSEFVSLHLPASPENFNLMNRQKFALMKRGAILINTARGPLIHEGDLCEALTSGQLGAAGLDVFQKEPLPTDSPLLKFENVLVSGHIAGIDHESNHDIAVMFAETIIGLYNGKWPAECVRNLKGRTGWKW